jgi:hypothetical protein
MQTRRLALCSIATLLILALASYGFASYSTTFIYTKFNSTDTTAESLDQSYTDITVDIYNHLMYNTSNTNEARIIVANTTAADKQGIMVAMKSASFLGYWKDGITDVQIANDTWTAGDIIELQVRSGVLSILHYDNATDTWITVLDDFHVSTITYAAVCALGSDVGTALGGYVSVTVSETGGSMSGYTDTITQWIPALISLAMLGVAVGFIKKMSM